MTPIAHTMIGLSGWLTASRRPRAAEMAAFVLAANLPDIDFLLRLLPSLRESMPHQYATHNLVFVLASGLLLGRLVRTVRARWVLLAVAASHLVLDLLVSDTVDPIGFPLLLPFSRQLFHIGGFPPLRRGDLTTVLSWSNLAVVLLEILIFAVPLWAVAGKRLRRLMLNEDFRKWR
ncbi:MAG: metal-dependent hydrolase [Acidobacteriota bacterium]|nr:metal-dependent hydrolase [Acidobacteriota bacterium]